MTQTTSILKKEMKDQCRLLRKVFLDVVAVYPDVIIMQQFLGLLHTLNTKYAMASVEQQQNEPNTIDDYTKEEQIIHSNQFYNLEYRIAFKRPSNSDIQRPIKRLKLSLEIDPTVSSIFPFAR